MIWRDRLLAGTAIAGVMGCGPAWAIDVATEAELRQAIFDIRDGASGGDTAITLTGNITLTQSLPMITTGMTINGGGFTIDADNTGRVFFVYSGTVNISNVTISNAYAKGGNGGAGTAGTTAAGGGGGGGLGAGAALFVYTGAVVTATNVTIADAAARGGDGGSVTDSGGGASNVEGGGGGLGGDGGSGVNGSGGGGGYAGNGGGSGNTGAGGGGGEFGIGGLGAQTAGGGGGGRTANGGDAPAFFTNGAGGGAEGGSGGNGAASGGGGGSAVGAGGAGGVGGGGGGGVGVNGGDGGTFGGGGGASNSITTSGGDGGFGGGGGANRSWTSGFATSGSGGDGGFGGGGAGGATCGSGGTYGGSGGTGGASQVGAGGGGGAALGGAVFSYGTLTISGTSNFSGTYTITAGQGGDGNSDGDTADAVDGSAGQALGKVLFLHTGSTTTLSPGTGTTITFANNGDIAGSGALVKDGAGTLAVTGSNDDFTGTVAVNGGSLSLGTSGGLGSGEVTLGAGGTLGGVGSVGGITVNGTVAPGNSIGTISVSGNVTFANGSTYRVEVNDAGQADKLDVSGSVDIQAGSTLDVVALAGTYATTTYTIITAAGSYLGLAAFPSLTTSGVALSGTFAQTRVGDDLRLTYTASSGGGGGGGGGAATVTTTAGDCAGSRFTACDDRVTFLNESLSGSLDGLAGSDIADFVGTTSLAGDLVQVETLHVGDIAGTDSAVTFASGSQTADSLRIYGNAALTLNSSLTAATVQVDSGGRLAGTGSVSGSVSSAGTIAPGNSIGTLTIGGALTLADSSVLEIEISGSGTSDRLAVGGAASLAGRVVVMPESGIGYSAGTSYTILTAASLSGGFAGLTVSDPADALGPYGLRLAASGSAVSLTVINEDFSELVPGSEVAAVMDADPDAFGDLRTALETADAATLAASLEALGAGRYGILAALAARHGRAFHQAIQYGLNAPQTAACGGGDMQWVGGGADGGDIRTLADTLASAHGRCQAGRAAGWLAPFGSVGSEDGSDFVLGGVAVGGDVAVGEHLRLGLTGAAAHATADFSGAGGNGQLDMLGAGGYAAWRDGPWRLDGMATVSFGEMSAERNALLAGTADADSSVLVGGVALSAAYALRWGGWTVSPRAGLDLIAWRIDGFRETGSDADLTVDDIAGMQSRSQIGISLGRDMAAGEWRVRPEFRLAAAYDWVSDGSAVTARFSDSGITVTGGDAVESGFRALPGLGVTAAVNDDVSLFASYDGEFGDGIHAHTLFAGVRVRW